MASHGPHHQGRLEMSHMHRGTSQGQGTSPCALLPGITTLALLSACPRTLLLVTASKVPSAIFINMKYVLLCLQLRMFK